MQKHIFLLIWTRSAVIGSFTGNIKLWLFPYVLRVFEEVFFCCFIWLVFRHEWRWLHHWGHEWGGERSSASDWTHFFILANVLNLEHSPGQKFVPNSLNDTPFEKWLLTSGIFIITLLFSPVFVLSLLSFFWRTLHYKRQGPVFHL